MAEDFCCTKCFYFFRWKKQCRSDMSVASTSGNNRYVGEQCYNQDQQHDEWCILIPTFHLLHWCSVDYSWCWTAQYFCYQCQERYRGADTDFECDHIGSEGHSLQRSTDCRCVLHTRVFERENLFEENAVDKFVNFAGKIQK